MKPPNDTRIIFVDHPAHDARIEPCQVIDGWTISPDPHESVAITVNGRPVSVHAIPRPDVEAAHPGCNAKGFMFFLQADSSTRRYRVRLKIGDVARDLDLMLAPEDLHAIADAEAARYRHREFLNGALACPRCHASITVGEIDGRQWSCTACNERYDCRDGLDLIPESYANKAEIRFQGAICSHGYDIEVRPILDEVEAAGGMALDCGAGWRHQIHRNVITTEILRYPSTDVVAVGEHLPFRDNVFEVVLSLHVLEHVKNPFVCAAELVRVLKPGGTLYAVTPYIVGVHGFPFHFFNPTPSGLCALFEGRLAGVDVKVPRDAHPIAALKDLLGVYANFFNAGGAKKFRDTRIGDLIDSSFEDVLSGPLTKAFHEEGKNVLAANYRIKGTKR